MQVLEESGPSAILNDFSYLSLVGEGAEEGGRGEDAEGKREGNEVGGKTDEGGQGKEKGAKKKRGVKWGL